MIKFFIYYLSRLPLLTFCIFFIGGVGFAPEFDFLGHYIEVIIAVIFLLTLFFRKQRALFMACLSILALMIGVARFMYFENLYDESFIRSLWGRRSTLEGVIVREPNMKDGKTEYVVKPDDVRSIYGFVVVKLSRYPEFRYGDRLKITGDLEEPEEFEDFSYKEYLKTQSVVGIMENAFAVKTGEGGNFLFIKTYNFKSILREKIKSELGEPHASLLLGILLGTRSGAPEEFNNALSLTGTTHIVAASGYNVSVLLAALMPLRSFFGRKITFLLSCLVLYLFIVVVGLENIPAVRAGIMGFMFLFSKFIGRKGHIISTLSFTAAFLIFLNPYVINSISFQLSFVSTIGLIVLSTKFQDLSTLVTRLTDSNFSTTLSAILATSPIVLLNFEKFSVVSLLVNMIVLPSIPLVMLFGFMLCFLILVPTFLTKMLSWVIYVILDFVIEVISIFGRFEFAAIDMVVPSYFPFIIYGGILFIFVRSLYKRYNLRYS